MSSCCRRRWRHMLRLINTMVQVVVRVQSQLVKVELF
jgi:hypothetical protein